MYLLIQHKLDIYKKSTSLLYAKSQFLKFWYFGLQKFYLFRFNAKSQNNVQKVHNSRQ